VGPAPRSVSHESPLASGVPTKIQTTATQAICSDCTIAYRPPGNNLGERTRGPGGNAWFAELGTDKLGNYEMTDREGSWRFAIPTSNSARMASRPDPTEV